MAQSTLALSPFPFFPQIVTEEIRRVDAILARYELSTCQHESPESSYGACDGGFPCRKTATVHDLSTGNEFCLEHFEGVICD